MPGHRKGYGQGSCPINRIGQGQIVGRLVHASVKRVKVGVGRRRDVDREQAPGKAALSHAGKVKMAGPIRAVPDRITFVWGFEQPEEEVVVTIKNGDHQGILW